MRLRSDIADEQTFRQLSYIEHQRKRIIGTATTMEEIAMTNVLLKGLTVAATAAAIAAFSFGASAQDKKAPAKKPPACNSLKDEAACKARDDCNWVADSKDAKGKVKRKAYCRSNPKK